MLLVFLMAAIFAIMMFMALPRIAMDAQRQREALLIARGEQYKRGIQMFMKKNNRWPATIEELESLNNQRFLRKRFVDPMTGKNEWRFIHIQNGVLTDSVLNKPKPNGDQTNASNFVYGTSSITGDNGSGQAGGSAAQAGMILANRKRASDGASTPGMGGGMPGDPNNPQQMSGMPGAPADPNAPQQNSGMPGAPVDPNSPQQPGMQQPGMANGQPYPVPPGMGLPGQIPNQAGQYPGQPGQQAGQPYPNQYPAQAGQYPVQFPGQQPNQQGQPVNSQYGGVSPQPYPTTPGANGSVPGYPQPGNPINPNGGANQAQQMIQQILTSPRPGGMPIGNGPSAAIGGGIAGVATNVDAIGIMVYNDHSNYKEWEFIFDPTKVKPIANPVTGAAGTPAAQMGSMGGSQIGTPVASMGGAAATGSGVSGFGSAPTGGLNQPPGMQQPVNPNSPGGTVFVPDLGMVPVVKQD
jgi:type II secretory pathway pseudopilin PulG